MRGGAFLGSGSASELFSLSLLMREGFTKRSNGDAIDSDPGASYLDVTGSHTGVWSVLMHAAA